MISLDQLVLACGYSGFMDVYRDYCYVAKSAGFKFDGEIALNSFTKFLLASADPNLNCPDWENQVLANLNKLVEEPLVVKGFCDQSLIEEFYNHFYN
jgi:hypothetical protein